MKWIIKQITAIKKAANMDRKAPANIPLPCLASSAFRWAKSITKSYRKPLFSAIGLVAISIGSLGFADQHTNRLNLDLPPVGAPNWGQAVNQNFQIIDSTVNTGGGGVGGGAPSLQVTNNGVQITSPTSSENFGTQFLVTAVGGSTAAIALSNNLVVSTITASSGTIGSSQFSVATSTLGNAGTVLYVPNFGNGPNYVKVSNGSTILTSGQILSGDIPDISATYLTNSSATATYLQLSSATATYANISSSQNFIYNNATINPQTATANITGSVNSQTSYKVEGNRFLWDGGSQFGTDTYVGKSGGSVNIGNNTGVGANVLSSVVSGGTQNTCVGSSACFAITTGNQNTIIGNGAGITTSTGSENTFVGYIAGQNVKWATNDTCTGYDCFDLLTTGNNNTAFGTGSAADITTGTGNTCLGGGGGVQPCQGIISGSSNTMVGAQAGNASFNGTESALTTIGYLSNANVGVNEATAIGYKAVVASSFTIQMGGTGVDAERVIMSTYTASSGTVTGQLTAGTGVFGTALTVAGQNVCEQNGTNCPASSGGSSALSVGTGTASQYAFQASSPTSILNFNGAVFTTQLAGSATAFIGLTPSSATLQGNTFNGTSQLVQTNGSGQYPALNGSLITNITGANIATAIPSSVLPSSTAYTTSTQTFTAIQTIANKENVTDTNGLALSVTESSASLTGNTLGVNLSVTNTPNAASVATVNGIFGSVTFSPTVDSPSGVLYGSRWIASNQGAGSLSQIYGISGEIQDISTSTIPNTYGVQSKMFNEGGGTITSQYGFYDNDFVSNGSTTTSSYGFYSTTPHLTGGEYVNRYGIYIASQSVAPYQNYAIYIDSQGISGQGIYQTPTGGANVLSTTTFINPVTASTITTYVINWADGSKSTTSASGGSGSGITALTGDVTASGTGSVAATLAALQKNVTTFGSSITVTNASGENVTYGVAVGSMTASSATVAGQFTAGTYQGAGLATCGSTSQAESFTSTGTFACTTITAGGIGALTANQSITWTGSGDITGTASGATSLTPTLTASSRQANITTLSASSVTITNNVLASTYVAVQNGATPPAYPSAPGQFYVNTNGYGQIVVQNMSNGTNASGDIVATSDLGGDTSNYVNLGIKGSHFNQSTQSIMPSTWAYLYSSDHGMAIGSGSNGTDSGASLVFFTSNPVSSNNRMTIYSTGTIQTFGNLQISSGVLLGTSAGTNGQVYTSGGPNTIPSWTTFTSASLASTQTWTAGQTFVSSVTVTSSGTVNGLLVQGNALNYGTNNPNGGAFETDCSNQTTQGYCAQFYSNQSTQTALDAVVNIYQANAGYNERALYIQALGQNNSPVNGIRMDGYNYISDTFEDTTMNAGGVQGIYQDSVHNNCFRRETRISGSFEDAFIVCHDTSGVSTGVNSDYGVPVSTFEDAGNLSVGSEGIVAPVNGLLVNGNAIFKSSMSVNGNNGLSVQGPESIVQANSAVSTLLSISTNSTGVALVSVSSVPAVNPADYQLNISSVTGVTTFGVQYSGHVISSGTTPTVATCGTGSPSVVGTDMAGIITTGGGSPTACTLNFVTPYANTPVCVCSPNAGVSCGVSSSSASSVTFALSVTETNINFICIGEKG